MSRIVRWMLRLDELWHRSASLSPVGDSVAHQLWVQLSDDRRDELRAAAWLAEPVQDPADARIVLALMDARQDRNVAERRWWALGIGVLLVVWTFLFTIGSIELRLVLIVVLIGLLGGAGFGLVGHPRRGLARQLLEERAFRSTSGQDLGDPS